MANKGSQQRLGATDPAPRPGRYPLGSAQSRAAARALLEARKESEVVLRVVTRSIVDGKELDRGTNSKQIVPPRTSSGLMRRIIADL